MKKFVECNECVCHNEKKVIIAVTIQIFITNKKFSVNEEFSYFPLNLTTILVG